MTRDQKLTLIYRHTHRDYKGHIGKGGERSILINVGGATTLVLLAEFSDAEIEAQLPYALKQEAKRKRLDR